MKRVFANFIAVALFVLLLPALSACVDEREPERLYRVVLGEAEHVTCAEPVVEVHAGESASFSLTFEEGYAFGTVDCDDYLLGEEGTLLTIPDVRFSRYLEMTAAREEARLRVSLSGACEAVQLCAAGANATFPLDVAVSEVGYAGKYELREGEVRELILYDITEDTEVELRAGEGPLTVREGMQGISYDANGGEFYGNGVRKTTIVAPKKYTRMNTLGASAVAREGYTLAGWSTQEDGSDPVCGRAAAEHLAILYASWKAWTPAARFTFAEAEGGLAVTGYYGQDAEVVVPASVGGMSVTGIATGAFSSLTSPESVVLPAGLSYVEDGAFSNLYSLRTLSLFDDLNLSQYAFSECTPARIILGAVLPPVYGTTENGQFANKLELLYEARAEKKLLFFGGCSVWYGVDSALAEEAFAGYHALNMGVIGGTCATFQMELIRPYLQEGDLFVHLPELISPYQLLYDPSFDQRVFMTLEANYDLVSRLDLTRYTFVLKALSDFLAAKQQLVAEGEAYGYEEGLPEMDERGDLRRARAGGYDNEGKPYVFPDPSALTNYHAEQSFAAQYGMIADMGASVYVGVSPFNDDGVFLPAGEELLRAVERFIAMGNAPAHVFMSLEDGAMDRRYIYDTNWHLSNEGARIYTERVIARLKEALAAEK